MTEPTGFSSSLPAFFNGLAAPAAVQQFSCSLSRHLLQHGGAVGMVEHTLAPLHLGGWVLAETPTVALEQSTRGRQDHSSVGHYG